MAHWGMFEVESAGGDVSAVNPFSGDADPSPILGNLPGSVRHRSRVAGPAVRRGWLEHGPGPDRRRGRDEFVAVAGTSCSICWRPSCAGCVDDHGNEAIFGGSYGWASAGRFHHAQSQMHRFLNCSAATPARVQHLQPRRYRRDLPHVVGDADWRLLRPAPRTGT